jgi:hypothetical protein
MKTTHVGSLLAALLLSSAVAAPPDSGRDDLRQPGTISVTTAGDGFILRGLDAVIIRNGVATKVNPEIVLPNGLRVQADGNVTMRDGSASTLRTNQLLTFEGRFVDLPRSEVLPEPQASTNTTDKVVGISARDGITISGADILLTRNGVTEKVTSDVRLPNGVIARPDGTILLGNGDKITLRADQVLGLNGVLHDAPTRPNPPGPAPSSSSPR